MSGHWSVTRTSSPTRRNLFDLTPNSEHQIATIVSGSRQHLERFDAQLALIEAAPQLRDCLRDALSLLDHLDVLQDRPTALMRDRVQALLSRLE